MVLRTVTRALARPRRPLPRPSRLVAVAVPAPPRPTLSEDECTSLRHLMRYLPSTDKYLIAPEDSKVALDGFGVKRFPKKFFGSFAAVNTLGYSPCLFEAFADYKYMFMYHLDSLVLSDQLEAWCAMDLDYIGPPFIHCADTPWVKSPSVGNGGFALFKVESFIRLLYKRHMDEPSTFWLDIAARNLAVARPIVRQLEGLRRRRPDSRLLKGLLNRWSVLENPGPHGRNCDLFWSYEATRVLPEFKVATVEQGLRFGFEASPRTCFALNGGHLPFGCHAWPRYDRAFWEPHLLREC